MPRVRDLRSDFGPVVPRLPRATMGLLPPRLQRQFQGFSSAVARLFSEEPSPVAMLIASQRLSVRGRRKLMQRAR
jgi:hypothetical protein